jgi:hypothetical protein
VIVEPWPHSREFLPRAYFDHHGSTSGSMKAGQPFFDAHQPNEKEKIAHLNAERPLGLG